VNGRRFRASSWGAGAIILAILMLILHRFGTFMLFLVIGGGLLWYGRQQREAGAADGREGGEPGAATPRAEEAPDAAADDHAAADAAPQGDDETR